MDVSGTIALLVLCLTCITFGYKIGKDIWKIGKDIWKRK